MFLSVCQDVHARMSALPYATERSNCHERLNAPFQGSEHNTKECMNSLVMVDAVPVQYSPNLPWQSVHGISSTSDKFPFPQTLQV